MSPAGTLAGSAPAGAGSGRAIGQDAVVVHDDDGVGGRHRDRNGLVDGERLDAAPDGRGVDQRPGGVVQQQVAVQVARGTRSRPRSSRGGRRRRRIAVTSGSPSWSAARGPPRAGPAATTTSTRSTSGLSRNAATDRSSTTRPASGSSCLGTAPPDPTAGPGGQDRRDDRSAGHRREAQPPADPPRQSGGRRPAGAAAEPAEQTVQRGRAEARCRAGAGRLTSSAGHGLLRSEPADRERPVTAGDGVRRVLGDRDRTASRSRSSRTPVAVSIRR